ncbi:MAG: hypothetical protein JST04_17825 [Bdellovibrionales bacterium]|nr:hypothetical protein [Bdellovibrionales bacterium]
MKRTLFLPLTVLGLLCLPLLAAEVDPRILAVMRKEQSSAQSFCFSFMHDANSRGVKVAERCLSFSASRYFANIGAAEADKDPNVTGDVVSRDHGEFCAAIGEFAMPGNWVKDDCQAWNRARAELFALGAKEGTPTATLAAKIDRVANAHRRFCQSLVRAGYTGEPSVFGTRSSLCFSTATNAKATDRAIFLGAF